MDYDALNQLVLRIYRRAFEAPAEAFIDWTFEQTRRHVPFDSGMWVMTAKHETLLPHALHLYQQPEAMILNYERFKDQDYLFKMLLESPERTLNPLDQLGPQQVRHGEIYHEHCRPFGLEHVLSTMTHLQPLNLGGIVSLYRDNRNRPYDEDERRFVELLMPHLIEAARLNLIAQLRQEALSAYREGYAYALCDRHGILHHAEPGFARVLNREWPDWFGPRLPEPLLPIIAQENQAAYDGARILLKAEPFQALRKLRIRERRAADALSPREHTIATLLAKGLSYKEIAKVLEISPSTVTNHANRIYQKLGVGSKTELASELAA